MVVGDSLVKHLRWEELSSKKNNVKLKSIQDLQPKTCLITSSQLN